MNSSLNQPPDVASDQADRNAWPEEQSLLLYLIEPSLLSAEQLEAVHQWMASSPVHGEYLVTLAEQVCSIAAQVPLLSANESIGPIEDKAAVVHLMKPRFRYSSLVWVATAAATVLIAFTWLAVSQRRSGEWSDEVAFHWANSHEPLLPAYLEALSDSELDQFSESTLPEQEAVVMDLPEDGGQAFGFSDSEPPEWLLAAFIEGADSEARESGQSK